MNLKKNQKYIYIYILNAYNIQAGYNRIQRTKCLEIENIQTELLDESGKKDDFTLIRR